jgi:hypothetical protein
VEVKGQKNGYNGYGYYSNTDSSNVPVEVKGQKNGYGGSGTWASFGVSWPIVFCFAQLPRFASIHELPRRVIPGNPFSAGRILLQSDWGQAL